MIGRGPWSVGARAREDLVVVRVPRVPLTGDPGDPVEHTLTGCLVWQEASPEDLSGGGEQVQNDHKATAAPDADVLAGDRVRRPGDPTPATQALRDLAPWQVIGDPARWTPGTVITLRRVSS